MNLKYYLRGLGIGLIVTTIILTVSNNVESASKSSGTVKNTEKEATSSSIIAYDREQTSTAAEATTKEETTTEAPTEATTEAPTEAPTQAPTEAPTQAPTEAPTQAPTEAPTEAPTQAATEAVASSFDGTTATIIIKDVYYGTQAADILYEAGIITDRNDFVQYLINTGYASYIQEGTYTINKGEDYKTICSIISKGRIG